MNAQRDLGRDVLPGMNGVGGGGGDHRHPLGREFSTESLHIETFAWSSMADMKKKKNNNISELMGILQSTQKGFLRW